MSANRRYDPEKESKAGFQILLSVVAQDIIIINANPDAVSSLKEDMLLGIGKFVFRIIEIEDEWVKSLGRFTRIIAAVLQPDIISDSSIYRLILDPKDVTDNGFPLFRNTEAEKFVAPKTIYVGEEDNLSEIDWGKAISYKYEPEKPKTKKIAQQISPFDTERLKERSRRMIDLEDEE